MIHKKSNQPQLIADVELMRHLRSHQYIPADGLHLNLPTEEFARILFNSYVSLVVERKREYVQSDCIENCIWKLSKILTTPSYRFGVIMTGQCGNGKTTMLNALKRSLNYILITNRNVIPKGIDLFSGIPIYAAKDIVKDMVYTPKGYIYQDVLMIDDLGHEPTEVMHYGMVHTPIVDLLEKRYARQKTTFVSSNLTLYMISQKYGNRIADRLEEMMYDIPFEGESFRR